MTTTVTAAWYCQPVALARQHALSEVELEVVTVTPTLKIRKAICCGVVIACAGRLLQLKHVQTS